MSQEFRELVMAEKRDMHDRQIKASIANLVEVYIILVLLSMTSIMFGFEDEAKWLFASGAVGAVIVPISLINSHLWKTLENKQWVYILDKYEFLPVDRKQIYKAKLYVEVTRVFKYILLQQVIALSARALAVSEEGGSFVTAYLFGPVIIATIYEVLKLTFMYFRQEL